jgi:hypothetical protein
VKSAAVELHDYLEAVVDESSFLAFVDVLARDRRESEDPDRSGESQNAWENTSIADFLEAGHAWAQDSAFGRSQGLADASPWKKFAVFLYCGKIYE